MRPFRLALDGEMVGAQRVDKNGQLGVAEPLVIRSRFWEPDTAARPRPDRKTHVPSEVRKNAGLQIRSTRLRGEAPAQHRQRRQRCRRTEHSRDEQEEAAVPPRIGPPPPFALQQTSGRGLDHGAPLVFRTRPEYKRCRLAERSVRGSIAFGVREVSSLRRARGRTRLKREVSGRT
jgi:hypothetical protein